MDEKLELLLDQINFPKESYHYFRDGNLVKIKGNMTKDNYVFYLKIDRVLPIDVFRTLSDNLSNSFVQVKNKSLSLDCTNIDYLEDYYKYFLDELSNGSNLIKMFKDNKVKQIDETFHIEVSNKNEKETIKEYLDQLKDCFNTSGFKIKKIVIDINEESSKQIRDEIEKSITIDLEDKIKEQQKREVIQIMGIEINAKAGTIDNIIAEENNVVVEAKAFDIDFFESKRSNFKIITLKITDLIDSIHCKIFTNQEDEYNRLKGLLKKNNWYKIRGYVKNDQYSKELVINARDIMKIESKDEVIKDLAPVKRVELQTHTLMSQMDGLIKPSELINFAISLGHKAVAVTDHNVIQSYPEINNTVKNYNSDKEDKDKFKMIYGIELNMINDDIDIVIRPDSSVLLENEYIVFDFETTGFNAGGLDSIIEIGAVKLKNGEITDRFSKLIDPGRILPPKITEITGITDDMLKGKENEETEIKAFKKWIGNSVMVAHNAKFDLSFIEMAYKKYDLGEFKNTLIDTLELSRVIDQNYARHNLTALVKRYKVPWDENAHHRADYDAEGTALVFHKMLEKLSNRNHETMNQLNEMVDSNELHKFGRPVHINLLAKNKVGLKNIFKIVSAANTKFLYKTPRVLRSFIEEHREGILIGSSCYEGEVFSEAASKADDELTSIINFYDFIEIQPLEVYDHLLQSGSFANIIELENIVKKIIKVTKETGKIIVASSDAHHLTKKDKIFREIIVNQKVPGGGLHPLSRRGVHSIPSTHFRTTDEMISDFSFLEDKDLIEEIVITNSNLIADQIEFMDGLLDTKGKPFSPKMKDSDIIVKDMVYKEAKRLYGEQLPLLIEERIEQELKGIIGGGFDVIYLISQKLVKKSNEEGYLVGSRGSVGSSFVATMMDITEVNPLPPHYLCEKCKTSLFEEDGVTFGTNYSCGYDLPDRKCEKCSTDMLKDGHDLPFAVFLGFNADKVPDIDLNFSGEYQWIAHEYTKELFGLDYVYRAGTIGTVADKTAYGYVLGYCEDKGINMRGAEIERLAGGCTGVKRTTGQHPGGIIVIPEYMDVYDFTPYQYPADDNESLWRTTHFDYRAIEDSVLKLDILGHDDPTMLKMLGDLSGVDVMKIPLDDKKTMSIFSSPDALGVDEEKINCKTGTLGVPEFGTDFVIGMLEDTRPSTFSELVKISGLSHGTDVWLGNAQELIKNEIVPFKDVIGCRDDIMVYLMYNNVEPIKAFKIMEFVRKGLASKIPDVWATHKQVMIEANIEEWFIDSCEKIKYMFPKAHAAAYVISAFRIAWFKTHHPILYYSAYFSVRCNDFDIDAMISGYDSIARRIKEIEELGYNATNKEQSILGVLKVALEATARGITFDNISLTESDSKNFTIKDDKTLIPPFRTIDGLGGIAASTVVKEREKGKFLSIEDVQRRGKVSATIIEKLTIMGVFDGMDESAQLSLF